MPQTDYSLYQRPGYEGMVSNTEPSLIRTGYNGGNTLIPYGRVVVRGTEADDAAVLPSASGGQVRGIAVATNIYEKAADGTSGYAPDKAMNILRRGVVFMVAEADMTTTSNVFYRFAMKSSPGTHEAIGRIRPNADPDAANSNAPRAEQITNAVVLRSGLAGEVIPVAFNLV